MTRLVVGVIGHVDHGKTALVRALTGTDTDRLPEERRRGISIALGFAVLHADDAAIDLIDMPGHERFVRTMVAGAIGIDLALLVIDAVDGVMPQTVEHAEIAGLLGVGRALVAVSRADRADAAAVARTAAAATRLLAANDLLVEGVIATSATRGDGIAALCDALTRAAAATAAAPPDLGTPFLPIDRAFAMAGQGVVATGTLRGGVVAVGDALILHPAGTPVRVRGVQVHRRAVAAAAPGQRVALNLRDAARGAVARGMGLAAPDALVGSRWLTVALRAPAGAPPRRNGTAVRVLAGTADVGGRLRLLSTDALEAGGTALAQLHLDAGIALPVGERRVVRRPSPPRVAAGGPVLDTADRRLRRHDPAVLARLALLRDLPPARRLAALIAEAGVRGTERATLARLTALSGARLDAAIAAAGAIVVGDGTVTMPATLEEAAAALAEATRAAPAGLARPAMARACPAIGAGVLAAAAARLIASGAFAWRGGALAAASPALERYYQERAAALDEAIAERLRASALTPPLPRAIEVDAASTAAVERLLRRGTLIRAVDRDKGKALLFHRDAVAAARATLAPLLAGGHGLSPAEIAAALGVSRKFAMPLLDHLDRTRFTRRLGDRRTLG